MSEDALDAVLKRAASDDEFANHVRTDPTAALAEFDLSPVELLALTCADEDGLRRLLGSEYDVPTVELAVFSQAALPLFHHEARDEMIRIDGARGGTKTTMETSHGVTCCCWDSVTAEA